jgi:toxin-antitoxin system PIN domain toxin
MIVPDLNILLHAHNTDAAEHASAKKWWTGVLTGPTSVGLAWVVILGFLRITTRRTVFARPLAVAEATGIVREWLAMPAVEIITPGEEHADILLALIDAAGTAGNLTTDAHLAALAIEYRAQIASTDYDFARFPKLRWFNPISLN